DTAAEKKLNAELRLERTGIENIPNPFDEYAIEEGLRTKEAKGGTVTALCMGPEGAKEALRKAIAMGVEKAVLVTDPNLVGSDAWTTAYVLSQAIKKLDHDLIFCGMQSTDAATALVPSALAEFLGIPQHTYTIKLEVGDGQVTSQRQTEGGYDVVTSATPALVAVVKGINEPRYPSLKGIMQAKRTEITIWSLADLGIDPAEVGVKGAKEKALSFSPREPRKGGQVVHDEGDAATKIAEFLTFKKVL
ncbi:MAG: electron transfer flavoprotein subunit beta/FixA family protein, partial [Dehalococcoidia bacterium]|nr:electron transfer flavoprotein subunit beta/FixA family protein [Dehalococcoidia bacterium]